jgi:hypothetical protein
MDRLSRVRRAIHWYVMVRGFATSVAKFPKRARCALYDLLQFERKWQEDENVVTLVAIAFLGSKK